VLVVVSPASTVQLKALRAEVEVDDAAATLKYAATDAVPEAVTDAVAVDEDVDEVRVTDTFPEAVTDAVEVDEAIVTAEGITRIHLPPAASFSSLT
jgi:hypothetical protein